MDLEIFTLSLKTFFDSNHITFRTYLDDTNDINKQCCRKINLKKAYFSQTRGKINND